MARKRWKTHSLDIATVLGKGNHALVGDSVAARDIQALKTLAVVGYGIDRALGYVLVL